MYTMLIGVFIFISMWCFYFFFYLWFAFHFLHQKIFSTNRLSSDNKKNFRVVFAFLIGNFDKYCYSVVSSLSGNIKRACIINFIEVPAASNRYTKRKESRLEEWSKLRKTFLNVGIQAHAITDHTCNICLKETEQLFRCQDCATWEKCCEDCLHTRHNYPHLHLFEAWQVRN